MNRFIIDGRYRELFDQYGINIEEVLRKAHLPRDLFAHTPISIKEEYYYRFIDSLSTIMMEPQLLIHMASADQIETFSPPIFASYCSENGWQCMKRLEKYKTLIGPMRFHIETEEDSVTLTITTESEVYDIPPSLVIMEYIFFLNILRKATKEHITPVLVTMKEPIICSEFSEFLGASIFESNRNAIVFRTTDLEIPFITYNESMWHYFEPELARRLSSLAVDESVSKRVRSALLEMLPSGIYNIENVASKMGMSKRTLQRKLSEEDTTFQQELNDTRKKLAFHYINNNNMTTNDIAYLLGYEELNSFFRAFSKWTGMNISEYKANVKGV